MSVKEDSYLVMQRMKEASEEYEPRPFLGFVVVNWAVVSLVACLYFVFGSFDAARFDKLSLVFYGLMSFFSFSLSICVLEIISVISSIDKRVRIHYVEEYEYRRKEYERLNGKGISLEDA